MKSAIAVLLGAMLALSPQGQEVGSRAQDAQKARIRQLELQMAKYRDATDKLIATLTKANDDLNERVRVLSRDRADMAIRIAKLEVLAEEKSPPQRTPGRSQPTPPRPQPATRGGLVYRGEYKVAVDNLNRVVVAMMRADSTAEAHKLLDGAAEEIEAARKALPVRQD